MRLIYSWSTFKWSHVITCVNERNEKEVGLEQDCCWKGLFSDAQNRCGWCWFWEVIAFLLVVVTKFKLLWVCLLLDVLLRPGHHMRRMKSAKQRSIF